MQYLQSDVFLVSEIVRMSLMYQTVRHGKLVIKWIDVCFLFTVVSVLF